MGGAPPRPYVHITLCLPLSPLLSVLHFPALLYATPPVLLCSRFLESFAPPFSGPQPLSLRLLISSDLLEKDVEGHTPSCERDLWSRSNETATPP